MKGGQEQKTRLLLGLKQGLWKITENELYLDQ